MKETPEIGLPTTAPHASPTGRLMASARRMPWPHAPLHQLAEQGTFIVTAGTYLKRHHFRGRERLDVLHRGLLSVARDFGWQLEAWAVFSNHYHFVAHSPTAPEGAQTLSAMLGMLHEKTAKWVNKLERAAGQRVWHNFRETRLTYERSHLARLSYVHQNAVKHKLVALPTDHPWCSARWLEENVRPAQVRTIYAFRTDKLRVYDDYEAAPEW